MSALTGFLYAALVAYLGGWYLDKWNGDFELLLFILTFVTLLYWLAERFRFKPQREAAATQLVSQDAARRQVLAAQGITQVDSGGVETARERLLMQPWWLDWTAGLFPVILVVFLMRSFIIEPFKIPSGSMVPTLLVGDLIVVNKFHYGVRLPVIDKKIIPNHDVQRGDVMVFRFPKNPNQNFIKRVIGVPGDTVRYTDGRLYLNDQLVANVPDGQFYDEDGHTTRMLIQEDLAGVKHSILLNPQGPNPFAGEAFPFREACTYGGDNQSVVCKVPAGHYFMMGDNRDNSDDSRFWGFVPDENIVGKAVMVWMNFGNLRRIGTSIH
ncbi:MAG: signal peptidase I [Paucibacter sp.]|nr:signal peptidase I [Roseateles sp.]